MKRFELSSSRREVNFDFGKTDIYNVLATGTVLKVKI
jgi:hypothetical protein